MLILLYLMVKKEKELKTIEEEIKAQKLQFQSN